MDNLRLLLDNHGGCGRHGYDGRIAIPRGVPIPGGIPVPIWRKAIAISWRISVIGAAVVSKSPAPQKAESQSKPKSASMMMAPATCEGGIWRNDSQQRQNNAQIPDLFHANLHPSSIKMI